MAKLTIQNTTKWSTADIRRAVRAAEKHFGLRQPRRVIVKTARNRGMRGRAAIGVRNSTEGSYVKLYLPAQVPTNYESFRLEFLWLVLHEVAHNAGLTHRDMGVTTQLNRVWGATEEPLSMQGLTIQWAEPAKATPEERVERRAAVVEKRATKAAADLARWERKLKLAKTKVSKLRAKVARYQKKSNVVEFPHANNPLYAGLHQLDERAAAKE
jgi:hypothetical protein